MKCLVTGGAGFIGSHIVELLLSRGFSVVGVDNMANGQDENIRLFQTNPLYSFHAIDIAQPFDENIFDVDYVFHFAALADIVPSIERPMDYHNANVTGTVRILEACRKFSVKKIVYAASSSCYGIPDSYPTFENAAIRPEYPYAFTKNIAEHYILFWSKLYQLPAVCLRLFNVYGTRARTNNTYGAVFKVFLSQKYHGKPLTIVGDGSQTRDFTYVTDVARAALLAAESTLSGEVINIATGKPQSVNYLAQLIGGPTEHIPKRPGEPDATHADITKARDLLHWEPSVSFEEGVKIMLENIDYWKDAPLWNKESIADATKTWFKYLGESPQRIFITGGAGYVGSALVPSLLEQGHTVVVYDLYLYGEVFGQYKNHPRLIEIHGDIRDKRNVIESSVGCDAMIHLACISNDPSFELNPDLGKSINYDAFFHLIEAVKTNSIRRFIYASSSSVYGLKSESNVTEDASLEPLTDYSRFKAECEKVLASQEGFEWVIIRPATVCGYAPRLRLDVVVNILTMHAIVNKKIKIFGGDQLRPNINIKDMVRIYELLLTAPTEKVHGQTFNGGYQNYPVKEIAAMVQQVCQDPSIVSEIVPTDDNRSYHINSDKIKNILGFTPQFTIQDAVQSLLDAFNHSLIHDPMNNSLYSNIKRMKEVNLV